MAANLGAINNVYQGGLDADAGHGVSPNGLYGYLRSVGANANEAHLLTSAAASESRFNPAAVHDNGQGYGFWGHNGDRLALMQKVSGTSTPNWQQQARFALDELRSRPEGKAAANATTPEQLALAEMHYEAPQGFTANNPEAGHNFTGRLNQIRLYTQLDPNASGSFAPSANPQVTPQQTAGAAQAVVPNQAGPATGRSGEKLEETGANPFAAVGDPALNAAIYKLLTSARSTDSASRPPLLAGLSNLLGGGGSQGQAAFGASPSLPGAPVPRTGPSPPQAPMARSTPVALPSSAAPAGAPQPTQFQAPITMTPQQPASAAVAGTSALPVFAQAQRGGLIASLAGMFGGAGA